MVEPLIITLDGPAGSGKSTVSRRLAEQLGLEFLDTGAMYRGIAAACLDLGIDSADTQAVAELAGHCRIEFNWQAEPPNLLINGRDVTDRLRDADVSAAVSDVAAIGAVRDVLVQEQRRIGTLHPRLVTEGRDQGSVVFPGAQVKFFLDADPAVRARRRADQIRQSGRDADEAEILRKILTRDERDASRKDGPLIKPDDAEVVDTSDLTLDQVLALLEQRVRERVGAALESAP